MDKNIFICYARKDLDIIKGFLYDLNEEASNYPFEINALIDKFARPSALGVSDHVKQSMLHRFKMLTRENAPPD